MENLSKMPVKRGDIVLVPFPFTNLLSKKVRPAVVISTEVEKTEFLTEETDPDFVATGLKKSSLFKMNKLLTIEQTKVLRKLGHTSPKIQQELDKKLKISLGLN